MTMVGVLLLSMVAARAEPPAAAPATQPAGQFSLATYNINFGNIDLAKMVATIRECGADLVCLQETNAQSERAIRNQLRGLYPHMMFRTAPRAGGFGVLSKKPVRNAKWLPPKFGWFGTWLFEVELAGRIAMVANVHLMPTVPDNSGRKFLKILMEMEDVRQQEVRHIHANLPKGKPALLLGDFNSVSVLGSMRFLRMRGFIDSVAAVTDEPERIITWHWKLGTVNYQYRIDYIYHTADFRTFASRTLESGASDHLLLVSALQWATEPTTKPTGETTAGR
jgi:endonuclease/exonuclease/phosphatase (EEP) superfamily protein YafD